MLFPAPVINEILSVSFAVAGLASAKPARDKVSAAAPAVDAPRYVEAFPALGEAKADWLKEDLKIPTKTSFNGVAIFSFPVDKAAFDKRKQVTMRIQLYDRPTLVATNTPTPAP